MVLGEGGQGLLAEVKTFVGTFAGLPEERLGEWLVEVRKSIDCLELEASSAAAAFAATDLAEKDGSNSAFDWIRHNGKVSGHVAANRILVGGQLDRLVSSSQALLEGRIGFGHLSLMAEVAKALADSPTGAVFNEESLLAKAREQSVSKFRHACERARHAGDPEGLAVEQARQVDARKLDLVPCEDGLVAVSGVLDQVGAGILRTALEPLARRQGRGDRRKRDRRLADALIELAGRGRGTNLMVTTSLETLLGVVGASSAEVEFSAPFSSKTVERLACDSTLTRVLLSESVIVDVGRGRRVVGPARKRALRVRDGGCVWPGCDRNASWTDAHHLVHWCRGGRTEMGNLVLLCHRHHWMVHEGGWQLVRTHAGRLLTVRPSDGCEHRTRGPDRAVA